MNIRSTKKIVTESEIDESVKDALSESTPKTPAILMWTPDGYSNLKLGSGAHLDPGLQKVLKPLGKLTTALTKDLFPASEGILDGIGYAIGVNSGIRDFDHKTPFEDALEIFKPLVKVASKYGGGILPDSFHTGATFADQSLTILAKFRKVDQPKEPTFSSITVDNLQGSPAAKYVGPLLSLGEALFEDLDSKPNLFASKTLDAKEISQILLDPSEASAMVALRKRLENPPNDQP